MSICKGDFRKGRVVQRPHRYRWSLSVCRHCSAALCGQFVRQCLYGKRSASERAEQGNAELQCMLSLPCSAVWTVKSMSMSDLDAPIAPQYRVRGWWGRWA